MNGDLLIVLYTNLVRRLTRFVGPRLTILRLVVHKGHMLVHKVKTRRKTGMGSNSQQIT